VTAGISPPGPPRAASLAVLLLLSLLLLLLLSLLLLLLLSLLLLLLLLCRCPCCCCCCCRCCFGCWCCGGGCSCFGDGGTVALARLRRRDSSMARLPRAVRLGVLGAAVCGMISALFWDEALAVLAGALDAAGQHAHARWVRGVAGQASAAGGGECPMLKAGGGMGGAGGGRVDLARLLNLDGAGGGQEAEQAVQLARQRGARGELESLSEAELRFYDGSKAARAVLVAVDGLVFDVTAARKQYASEGSYGRLAGRPISRALTLSSLSPDDMTDDAAGLDEGQLATRARWTLFFAHKYPIVALLAAARLSAAQQAALAARRCAHAAPIARNNLAEKGARVWLADNGDVLDLSTAQWLYGTQGVRFGEPPRLLYPCAGTLLDSTAVA
jgi:hypothetical protein